MKVIFNIFLLLFCLTTYGQTITYSYIDPCTGVVKKLEMPGDKVTVTYYNQIKSFSRDEIQSGQFDAWANSIYSQFGQNSPCGTAVGLTGAINITQNSAINVIGILNSISMVSDLQAANSTEGGSGMVDVTAAFAGSNKSSNKKENKTANNSSDTKSEATLDNNTTSDQQSSDQTNVSSNKTTPQSESQQTSPQKTQDENNPPQSSVTDNQTNTDQPSNNQNPNGTGSNTEYNAGGSNDDPKTTPDQTPDANSTEKKSTNILGGAVSSIANASGKSEGNKPTIVLSSDFTGFNFKNNDVIYGGKVTGGFTSMRWDGRRTHGILFDYTSLTKGPNATAFYALINKKRIDLLSVTGTVSFIGKGSLYGTMAIGQMWNIKKNAKIVYLATTSWGQVFQEKFVGTAFVAGGMYDFKAFKRADVKLMGLFIYAPFVSYYNDIVLKSPYVVMPIIGTNLGITKKFKLNINMGGTYAIRENVMNFTIMMGTRFAL